MPARLLRFHPAPVMRCLLVLAALSAAPLAAQPADATVAFADAMDAFVSETLESLDAVPGLA